MRSGLSKPFLFVTRTQPALVRSFFSLLPLRLHRHSVVQKMLRATSGLHLTVRTRLDNGMPIMTFVGDEIGNQIYTCGLYETATANLVRTLLDKETTFFDIGAHIGQYTLIAAHLADQVHCFEPMPWIYKILKSNIERNKLTNVISNPCGVMDYAGFAEVWEGPKENSGSGSFLRIPGFYDHSYSVECVTLDAYCERKGLKLSPRKVLIKMDVERTELNVLHGAVGVFQYEPTAIVEFNDWSDDLEKIVRFFEERKYTLRAIYDSELQHNFTIGQLFPQRRQSMAVNILAEPPRA
jgi:FkbM family methyltransferase